MEVSTETMNVSEMPVSEQFDYYRKAIDLANLILGVRSADTMLHATRAQKYTEAFCNAYNTLYPTETLSREEIEAFSEAAMLHDIGKLGVADDILYKRGRLSTAEFELIKQHTVVGSSIAQKITEFYHEGTSNDYSYDICRYHHERFDGHGYPEGLAGNEIPLCAQIVSIVDVYDALTSERVYKEEYPHEIAAQMILGGECGQFNPKLIKCFIAALDPFKEINTIYHKRKNMVARAVLRNPKYYLFEKRLMDIIFSSTFLLLFSPVFLLVPLAIFIDDPKGSPIYRQVRVGMDRKPFMLYKFRTMVVGADKQKSALMTYNEKDGPVFKVANDPRITRIGRLLRKTSIDEFPQFFNILIGNMSLVGPRPPLSEEVAQYSRYHEMRLGVKPGLTCEWQVQPNRDDVKFEEWMDMDVTYIGERSIAKDINLLFRTFISMLRRDGS